jgi:hypothetical protein
VKAPATRNRKRGDSNHTKRSPRTLFPPLWTGNNTLIDKAIFHLWPWTVQNYPGPRRAMRELLRRPITWSAVRHWRTGRHPMPAWAAADLLAHLEGRVVAGHALAEELRHYIPGRNAVEARQLRERVARARAGIGRRTSGDSSV